LKFRSSWGKVLRISFPLKRIGKITVSFMTANILNRLI